MLAGRKETVTDSFGISLDTVEGGVYTKELYQAEREGRIGNIIPHPDYPINVVLDIGKLDYTAIWFCQFLKDKVLLLDYYQNNHMSLPDYISVIFGEKCAKKRFLLISFYVFLSISFLFWRR
ncbi:hypothetical protein AGMMS49990_09890 [Endomicrobiia bacterium]|nr:hypothetical protein AGMMS49990_09890 [Endomicrobiia bacterium]